MLIIAVGVCARAWILFNTQRMPGMNGAYSLVQARSLIEKGALGLPDFPLMFALHAAVALAIQYATGWAREPSITLAVKTCLALLPPFAAIPVFLLGRRWVARAGDSRSFLPLIAAAMVSFGAPVMAMTGNFDKNALALVWLSALLLAMHTCMERPSFAGLAATVLCLVLLGTTHIGAFGAGLVLAVCVCGVYITHPEAPPFRVTLPAITGAFGVVVVVEGLIFWNFDPARIERLIGVVTDPVAFMSRHAGPGPGPSMMGGPPSMSILVALAQLVLMGTAGGYVLRVVWKCRGESTGADSALVAGSVVAILLMTGPWIHNDAAMRLILIASLPATLVGMFVLLHLEHRRARQVLTVLACLGVVIPGVIQSVPGGWRVLSGDAYDELKSLSTQIPKPEHTLIVAMHGVEWNIAWALHTHVAQVSALRASDWQRYDDVFFLVLKDDFRPGGPPGRPERGPGHGPRPWAGPEMGPGPEDAPRPPMMPMARIPEDAEVLHDGQHLTLARVSAPPASLNTRP